MTIRTLDKSQCKDYFDHVSRELGGTQAEIEVAGLGLGSQVAHDWTPLRGIVYDPRTDALEIVTDDLDHLIASPREVHVEDGADGLHSVEIIDAEGNHQVVRLRSPLMLPEGSRAQH